MSKRKKRQQQPRKKKEWGIPEKYQHPVLIVLLILLFAVFFHEAWFQGKVFIAADNIASQSYTPYREAVIEQGEQPLWMPYLFSGMPGFASLFVNADRWYDFTREGFVLIMWTFRGFFGGNDVFRVVFYHLILALALYSLIHYKVRNAYIAFFAAASFSFGTGIIIWIMAAHNIKALSFAIFPLMLLFAEIMKERIKLWHIVVLTIGIHIGFTAHHIQMFYYAYLGTGIYFAFFIIRNLIKKVSVWNYIRTGLVIAGCSVAAFLMSSDRYLSTWEYNQYSQRGAPPVTAVDREKPAQAGLDYDYATGWSFSPQEITTFFVPSFYGFGNHWYEGPLTNYERVRVNTYFGQMPFTEQPMYMGIILLSLAFVGAIMYRKDPFIQYLLILSAISLLISFGRNFPVLYDLFYHYMPLFNSFRVPSMILILFHTSVAICAAYGLAGMYEKIKQSGSRSLPVWLRRTLVSVGVIFVLSIIARGTFEQSYIGLIESSGRPVPPQLFSWIYERMINDLSFNFGLLVVLFGLITYAYRSSPQFVVIVGAVTILSITDLWRISYRPMHYQPAEAWEQVYRATDAVQYVKNDDSVFRIARLQQGRPVGDNQMAYYLLQDIHGYHPAKIRVYQDMLDEVGIHNAFVWNLLNVKYVITDQPRSEPYFEEVFRGEQIVYENTERQPRAWFVDTTEVRRGIDILRTMREGAFDPSVTAYINEPLSATISAPDENSQVQITDYGIHTITADVSASGTHFLVFSEVYYPPGWRAFLNGEEIDIIQTNHFQRGMVIPEGEHELQMLFESRMYERGKIITLFANIIILGLGFGLVLVVLYYRNKPKRSDG